MNTTPQDEQALRAAGFEFEYPGYWSRFAGEREAVISDGPQADAGGNWVVQIMENGRCTASEDSPSAEAARLAAYRLLGTPA